MIMEDIVRGSKLLILYDSASVVQDSAKHDQELVGSKASTYI